MLSLPIKKPDMARMRIAVCNSQTPFEYGGSEMLAESLVAHLRAKEYEAALVTIPFRHYPNEEILKGYLAWRLVNMEESEGRKIDRVICLKFPSYAASHPCKVTWLIQQLRQAYDLHGTPFGTFSNSLQDSELRATIQQMDTRTIHESRRIFAISHNVARRLEHWNGLSAKVLYPPPAMDERLHHNAYGDYILSVSRLDELKRVDLLIRAMGLTKSPALCRIIGRGRERDHLEQLAQQAGAAGKVEFLGFMPDEDVLDAYANALAVYYAPVDEDYGLSTIEAMKSAKPVLTASDSGGVLEFVQDGITGAIVNPADPAQLAARIDQLYLDRRLAAKWGSDAQGLVEGITWDAVIPQLLAD
jgi:glycosyltransferase involved in cell wall biosynthesis